MHFRYKSIFTNTILMINESGTMSKRELYARILIIEVIIFFVIVISGSIYHIKLKKQIKGGADSSTGISDMVGSICSPDASSGDEEVIMASAETSAGITFDPHSVDSTAPDKFLRSWDIEIDGQMLPDPKGFKMSDYIGDISFNVGKEYTKEDGIFTFRGNNFRDTATYGYTDMKNKSMEQLWTVTTGALSYGDAVWTGSGWTGQPLIRRWSKETRQHMNMFDWAKDKEDLVEVIYACMDGYIYFLDLETGEATRDRVNLGFTFKGAGALDPRGYPVMYLGAGYDSANGYSRAYIINLLDCSVMKEFGSVDPFALRGTLSYFDSSALVDAETDTLIYPGENGVLYFIHVGTNYDEASGRLSMSFDKTIKWRYNSNRTTHDKFWPGMETSAAIYEHYLYITDNGANLLCVDLDTLSPVWVQDILDDSNSTPVLSIEDGHLYLYVSTSFHLGWRSNTTAPIPIWKIDAETGEIIWQTEYECASQKGVSGGVQSTIALGKNDLNDRIIVTVSMTHGGWGGDIVALSKADGSKLWENQTAYTWSSPVCIYDEDGHGKVIYGASNGALYGLDGKTGEIDCSLIISTGNIEASPAVYKDTLIIGTRAGRICGIKLR